MVKTDKMYDYLEKRNQLWIFKLSRAHEIVQEAFLLNDNILFPTSAVQYQLWRLHDASKTFVWISFAR